MIAVTGLRTTIVGELVRLTGDDAVRIGADLSRFDCTFQIPEADFYVLAAGVLCQRPMHEQTSEEIAISLAVNLVNVIRLCEEILRRDGAQICVVGSESGERGSYDTTYAAAKAGVHQYVRNRIVSDGQKLVCVAPTIIADSGMTRARKDYPEVLEHRRTVTAESVARSILVALKGPSNRVVSL